MNFLQAGFREPTRIVIVTAMLAIATSSLFFSGKLPQTNEITFLSVGFGLMALWLGLYLILISFASAPFELLAGKSIADRFTNIFLRAAQYFYLLGIFFGMVFLALFTFIEIFEIYSAEQIVIGILVAVIILLLLILIETKKNLKEKKK